MFDNIICRLVNTGYDSPAQQSLATVRGKLRPFFLEQVFFVHLVLLHILVLPLNLVCSFS